MNSVARSGAASLPKAVACGRYAAVAVQCAVCRGFKYTRVLYQCSVPCGVLYQRSVTVACGRYAAGKHAAAVCFTVVSSIQVHCTSAVQTCAGSGRLGSTPTALPSVIPSRENTAAGASVCIDR